jgi:hypothetical protein
MPISWARSRSGSQSAPKRPEFRFPPVRSRRLKYVVRGFDLVGMAVGIVPLDRIITGRDLVPGDVIIGLERSGIHSNGLTLARYVFFERGRLAIDHVFPELGIPLGEELLCPTFIYVPEILDIINNIPSLEALINITGDGLLNLPRVDARVGFMIDDLPPVPPVFRLIQQYGAVDDTEMFEVYNMGWAFASSSRRETPVPRCRSCTGTAGGRRSSAGSSKTTAKGSICRASGSSVTARRSHRSKYSVPPLPNTARAACV